MTSNRSGRTGIRLVAVGIGLLGFALDQLTKWIALAELRPGQPVEVIGTLLRWILIRNPGAAFGMGGGFTIGYSIFAVVALIAALVIGLPRIRRLSHAVVLGLLLAGIAGNLFDRIFREPGPLRGHVIDFIALPNFAIFNVADMCITFAAVGIIILAFTTKDTKPAEVEETA